MPDLAERAPGALAGLVLAAGAGRRLGQPKAGVRCAGRLLVDRAVDVLRDGGCDPVIVVLGAGADAVRRDAALDGVVVVDNGDWRRGMATSLRCGLGAAKDAGVAGLAVLLVDQPLIGPEAVRRVRAAWLGGARVAVATYDGRQGHPVLLDRSVWPGVRATAVGDNGARAFLERQPQLVTRVACDGTGSPHDIDTQEDLVMAERALLQTSSGPPPAR